MNNEVRDYLVGYVKEIEAKQDQLNGLTGVLQFDFTDDGNGIWYIELVRGKPLPPVCDKVEDAKMTIIGGFDVTCKLRAGEISPEEVVPTGKVKMEGDPEFMKTFADAGLN